LVGQRGFAFSSRRASFHPLADSNGSIRSHARFLDDSRPFSAN
jgi:hypothetical protein